jgi:hypothetical protein
MSKIPRIIKPGAVVVVTEPDSKAERDALVVKQNADGSLRVRPKRYPTSAELESGNYTTWVKTPRRVQFDEVLRVIAKPHPKS